MSAPAGATTHALIAVGTAPSTRLARLTVTTGNAAAGSRRQSDQGLLAARQALADGESLPVPYITCLGRKGGSPCAVSAVNALLLLAEGGSEIKG